MWTLFWDMHSGGDLKLNWSKIYVELPRDRAIEYFKTRFGRDPYNVTCSCCGEDYSISEEDTLEQVSGYHRNCAYDVNTDKYVESSDDSCYFIPLDDYRKLEDVLIISWEDMSKPISYADLKIDKYTISLSKMLGLVIKDVTGFLTSEMGDVVFQVSKIKFEDGTILSVEGEHDCAYLVEIGKNTPKNYNDELLQRLYEESEAE